jgi:hypothetical protein
MRQKMTIWVMAALFHVGWVTKSLPNMNVLELHEKGVIEYLFRTGMVSSSMVTYIGYYQHFLKCRGEGMTYRETVRHLSIEHRVSETTIKKAVRMLESSKDN